jgi:AraC family ethanolamine operon transcriptional activator
MFAFTVPLRCGPDTSYWSATLHESGLPVMMPGGVYAEFAAGQQHLMALVDLDLLRECVPDDLMASIETAACQHVAPASGDAVARLGAMLNTLLDEARAEPQGLRHPHALHCMQQDVLTAFCQALTPPVSPPRRVGSAIRQRRLQRAVEYLRSADTAMVTVGDLCAAASLAERTLEYAFREAFGITPNGFLHLRRYHAARRDLLAADGRAATVQAIAQHNGFYHMGRFAIRYRQLFGESPSRTLMKPPLETLPRLPPWQGLGLK